IIADRDPVGYLHAYEVSKNLRGTAVSVQVVEAAQGKDVTDHLAAGLSLGQLVPVKEEKLQATGADTRSVGQDEDDDSATAGSITQVLQAVGLEALGKNPSLESVEPA